MKPLVIFYSLVFYILIQFGWWAYLLIDLNSEVYLQKIEALNREKNPSGELRMEDHELIHKMHERWWMVAGEGAVFLGLLMIGIVITRKAIFKEVELARQQKNFILSVTHEFKSPLAAIKLNLQTLQKHQFEKEKQHAILRQAIHEADRINVLVENALMVARIEGHSYELAKEEICLGDFISDLLKTRVFFSTGQKVEMQAEADVYITGDPLALTSVVLNLIENAEKYSSEDSVITIKVNSHSGHAILEIIDQGAGIPDAEKERVFDKFYRVGNEDTRKSKGTGLGLFIVKHIVEMHRGSVTIRDNSPKGSIFVVSFPLAGNLEA